jgi:MSHA pilin protein MshD
MPDVKKSGLVIRDSGFDPICISPFCSFSARWPVARRPLPRASRIRGMTLVEVVISIAIVAIAAGTVLGLLSMLAKGSADAMIRNQAAAIATAYLEEIKLKNFTADGVEASRALYDDVSDYNGLVDSGARDQLGTLVAGLDAYTVRVTVGPGTLGSIPAASVKRIDVNVQHVVGINMTISGYRAAL